MLKIEGFITVGKGEGGFGVGEREIVGVGGETRGAASEEEHRGNDIGPCRLESLVVASRTMDVSGICVLDLVRQCFRMCVRGRLGFNSAW